jgi:hypothetical protein
MVHSQLTSASVIAGHRVAHRLRISRPSSHRHEATTQRGRVPPARSVRASASSGRAGARGALASDKLDSPEASATSRPGGRALPGASVLSRRPETTDPSYWLDQ